MIDILSLLKVSNENHQLHYFSFQLIIIFIMCKSLFKSQLRHEVAVEKVKFVDFTIQTFVITCTYRYQHFQDASTLHYPRL